MKKVFAALVLMLALPTAALAQFQVPPLEGPVNDRAGMLRPDTERLLDRALRKLWNSGGSQIAVLTVKDLGGLSIEEASIKVVDQWKLGTAKKDNGVLVLVAQAEREARIEVGQGLEGDLPDAYARRIIDGMLVPRFKGGLYDEGIVATVVAIAQKTDPDVALDLQDAWSPNDTDYGEPEPVSGKYFLFILFFFFAFGLLPRMLGFRGRRRGTWTGSSWGGGSSGGFGGFSGGGGGFSGGGASGKW